jgi:hypothetical protein
VKRPKSIGRGRELAAIDEAVDLLGEGRGSVLLLGGEAGIGKTHLLHHAADRLREAGVPTAWGVAWDGGGAPAYWPLVQALRALAVSADADAADALLVAAANLLTASGREEDGRRPEELLARSYDEVSTALGRFVRGRARAALLLDDLHATDRATLSLLAFLTRAHRATPILFVCAHREAEVRASPEASKLVADIAREGRSFSLARFDAEETRELVLSRASDVDPDAIARLHARTLGNPLFAVELLALPPSAALPGTVREVIEQRLARLSDGPRRILGAASVLGTELSVVALAGVAEIGVEESVRRLAEPTAAGFLVDEGGTRYRFAHPLFRETLLAALTPQERALFHERAARTLERMRASGVDVAWGEIAHHHLSAGTPSTASDAVNAALRAARDETKVGAYDHAARLLERARVALDLFDAAAEIRIEVLLALAEACARAGERDRGHGAALAAATLARARNDPERLARAALAYGTELGTGTIDPTLSRLLEEADRGLGSGDSPLRARVLARLAASLVPGEGTPRAVPIARAALEMARRCCAPEDALGVMMAAGSALIYSPRLADVVELERETAELAMATDDRAAALRTRARLVLDEPLVGNLPAAEAALDSHTRLTAERERPHNRVTNHLLHAFVASIRGRFEDALDHSSRARAILDAHPDDDLGRSWLLQRLALLRDAGSPDELRAQAADISKLGGFVATGPAVAVARAALFAASGALDDARAELSRVEPDHPMFRADYTPALFAADAVSHVGDRARAERLLPVVSSLPSSYVSWGRIGMHFEGPASRYRALLLAVVGRADEAIAILDGAIADARSLGAPPAVLRLRIDRARILAGAHGMTQDLASELASIASEADHMGARGIATRARRLVPEPVAAPSPPGARPARFEREGDAFRVTHRERSFVLRSSRGLELLARLVAEPDHEIHVLDLVGAAPPGERDEGDAGELLDESAKAAYRARLLELAERRAEADARADTGLLSRIDEEVFALEKELSRAVGLGGRSRRAPSAAERARSNVQRRLKDAIERIREHDPELGHHLAARVSTGTYCIYRTIPRSRD